MSSAELSPIYFPLRIAYGLVPIIAGLDKFSNLLVHWDKYLPGFLTNALPFSPHTFMIIVGIIEIVAGLVVLSGLTRLGAYVVMAWLILISINLILAGFYDIAVRDLVMALGAYTLGQIAALRGESWLPLSAGHGAVTHAVTR